MQTNKSIDELKLTYPSGTRVQVLSIGADEPHPVPNGAFGFVSLVDDIGTIHVNWDNGSTLGLVYGVDLWETIKDEPTVSVTKKLRI